MKREERGDKKARRYWEERENEVGKKVLGRED